LADLREIETFLMKLRETSRPESQRKKSGSPEKGRS